jgi:hypothetical protein
MRAKVWRPSTNLHGGDFGTGAPKKEQEIVQKTYLTEYQREENLERDYHIMKVFEAPEKPETPDEKLKREAAEDARHNAAVLAAKEDITKKYAQQIGELGVKIAAQERRVEEARKARDGARL